MIIRLRIARICIQGLKTIFLVEDMKTKVVKLYPMNAGYNSRDIAHKIDPKLSHLWTTKEHGTWMHYYGKR